MDFNFKSLIELVRYFKDEKTCYDFLESQIWHDGQPACPHCGSLHVYTRSLRSKNPAKAGVREYKCAEKGCNKNFTSTVGTIFESSKLPLQTWFCAIWLCTTSSKGISSANLAKQLNITQKSAWFVLSRIREMFAQTAPHMVSGMVEVDETFVGGKEKNKSKSKRAANKPGNSKRYDKAVDTKAPVLGILQRNGEVFVRTMVAANRETLLPILLDKISPDATVVTDGLPAYRNLHKHYQKHVVVAHHKDEWVNGEYHTNTIEGFWATMKRGIVGVYHYTSPKHLQRYCNEYAYRYNNRDLTSVHRFSKAIEQVVKARITYSKLIS